MLNIVLKLLQVFVKKGVKADDVKKTSKSIYNNWNAIKDQKDREKQANVIVDFLEDNVKNLAAAIRKSKFNEGEISSLIQELVDLYNGVKTAGHSERAVQWGNKVIEAIRVAA